MDLEPQLPSHPIEYVSPLKVFQSVICHQIAVGAPNRENEIHHYSYAGCVYVFTRSYGHWTIEKAIYADDGVAQDLFGTSVAMDRNQVG